MNHNDKNRRPAVDVVDHAQQLRAVARQQSGLSIGTVAKLGRGQQHALTCLGTRLAGNAADDQRHQRP